MTGEITLSGRVLPVGGIKEKVLAARRVGIREVIMPRPNEKNVNEDLTDELRRDMTIHYVQTVDEVLLLALTPVPEGAGRPTGGPARSAADSVARGRPLSGAPRSPYRSSNASPATVFRSMISPVAIICRMVRPRERARLDVLVIVGAGGFAPLSVAAGRRRGRSASLHRSSRASERTIPAPSAVDGTSPISS